MQRVFSNRSIKAIVYASISFVVAIIVLSISQVSHSAYPNPTGAVYVEHAVSRYRINMSDRRNGGQVILHPQNDSIDQKLWIEKNPDDWTFSLWVDNTYARLSTQFTPTSNGTQTEVWMSGGKGDPMQTMRATPREGYPGQYLLEFVVNGRATGQCLDVNGGAKDVRPHTWGCDHKNNNQGFVIISRNPPPPVDGQISLPFSSGQTWYVCQGYNSPPTHKTYPALDLTVAKDFGANACYATDGNVNKSAGKSVLAPANGKILNVGISDMLCLQIDNSHSILIGHINRTVRFNDSVSEGTQIGTVAQAGDPNGRYAHIHIEARQSASCQVGTTVPFTSEYGFQFRGVGDLPRNQTHFTRELRKP